MKKNILIIVGATLISAGIILVASIISNQTDKEVNKILNDSRQSNFKIVNSVEKYKSTTFGEGIIKSPTGVLIQNQKVVITDSVKNCVFIFNRSGHLLQQIGSTGNGKGQFLRPHQIRFYANQYYVLDSGNNRIQIFNNNFEYYGTIELNAFKEINFNSAADFSYSDMDIDGEGNIFVSVLAISAKNTHIYKIDKNKIIYQIGDNLVGYLTAIDGNIYFINHKTVFTAKYKGKMNSFYVSYDNYLYKIKDNKPEIAGTLPYKYDPTNFSYDPNSLFLFSDKFNTLDKFDRDGHYISTLYRFEPNSKIRYLDYDRKTGCFLATSPENSKVYLIEPLTRKADDS